MATNEKLVLKTTAATFCCGKRWEAGDLCPCGGILKTFEEAIRKRLAKIEWANEMSRKEHAMSKDFIGYLYALYPLGHQFQSAAEVVQHFDTWFPNYAGCKDDAETRAEYYKIIQEAAVHMMAKKEKSQRPIKKAKRQKRYTCADCHCNDNNKKLCILKLASFFPSMADGSRIEVRLRKKGQTSMHISYPDDEKTPPQPFCVAEYHPTPPELSKMWDILRNERRGNTTKRFSQKNAYKKSRKCVTR